MRLIRLSAYFGALDGAEVAFAPGRLQLIVGSNERDTSTLVAAILAALYGLAPANPDAAPEIGCDLPLSGSRCDVELDLEDRWGRRLRVQRDLVINRCSVTDLDRAEDVTAEFATSPSVSEVGQALLGLTREQCLHSVLVQRGELGVLADASSAHSMGGNLPPALHAASHAHAEQLAEAETSLAAAIERRQEAAIRAASRAHLEAATAESVEEVLRAEERLRQAESAEQAAVLERATAEAQAGPTDRDLQRRFGSRPDDELEEMARYPQRRAELQSLIAEREPPRQAARPPRRRPLWLALGVVLAVAGVALATQQPIAGAPLAAVGLALAVLSCMRRSNSAGVPDMPFLRGEAQRRLKALDDRVFVLATSLGYRSPGEAIGALQAWQDAHERLEQRSPWRRIEEVRERLAEERRDAARVLARWGWSAGRGATAEMLASLHQEMAAHLHARETLERCTRAEAVARQRLAQLTRQTSDDHADGADQAGTPAVNATHYTAASEPTGSGLARHECGEALPSDESGLGSALPLIVDEPQANGDDERFVAAMARLAAQAATRQVIVLSCNAVPHRRLLAGHPEIAARVHILTLANSAPVSGG